MDVLHRGFDGLDVSFQGRIDAEFEAKLEAAKVAAADEREDQLLEFRGVKMHVAESGARGGYAYRCDTGPFGATWFFKEPNARDPWGVRVSCKSLPLAVHGLGWVRADIYAFLEALGIATTPEGVSIGRVDYAVDILAPGFTLNPDYFVMHSHSTRADHVEGGDMGIVGRSGRCTSVTIGKMPGRQVIVYDKRTEVIAKHKVAWWEIWNAAREAAGAPPLDPTDAAASTVWRVELRAGKKHLRDRWRLRTWADLDYRLGNVLEATLDAVSYRQPSGDGNRARWPEDPLWAVVREQVAGDLFEMRSETDPDLVKEVMRAEHQQMLLGQMAGLSVALAVAEGSDAEDYEGQLARLPRTLLKLADEHATSLGERFEKVKARYAFR